MSSSRGCAVAVLVTLLASGVTAQEMSSAQRDVWLLEESYWRYVTANDIESYKSLWHEDFVGWPLARPRHLSALAISPTGSLRCMRIARDGMTTSFAELPLLPSGTTSW